MTRRKLSVETARYRPHSRNDHGLPARVRQPELCPEAHKHPYGRTRSTIAGRPAQRQGRHKRDALAVDVDVSRHFDGMRRTAGVLRSEPRPPGRAQTIIASAALCRLGVGSWELEVVSWALRVDTCSEPGHPLDRLGVAGALTIVMRDDGLVDLAQVVGRQLERRPRRGSPRAGAASSCRGSARSTASAPAARRARSARASPACGRRSPPSRSTSAWFALRASGVKRGSVLRKSVLSNVVCLRRSRR